MVKACLNGIRLPSDHPRLPVTPAALAADAGAVQRAGAFAVHVHVKDLTGHDTLAAGPLADTVRAIREVALGLPIGVTTGAWAAPDPADRVAAVRDWAVRPDFASVNWHESGAQNVAKALLDQGIGVEAGLWTEAAMAAWIRSPLRSRCLRVLLELPDSADEVAVVRLADRMMDRLGSAGVEQPILMHGEGASAWPVLRHAIALGLDTRIGLEDTLRLPDGRHAAGNAQLVTQALDEHSAPVAAPHDQQRRG